MDDSCKKELIDCGINVEDAILRFLGREDMYEKFLIKFLHDKTYDQLKHELIFGNAETSFRASHSLKGVVANLSMTSLYDLLSKQVDAFKSSDIDSAKSFQPDIDTVYKKIIDVLQRYYI